MEHKKLWKILREMAIPHHLTCLLRNLYAAQESIVRTRHGTMDWSKLRKDILWSSKRINLLPFTKLGKEYFKAVYCHLAYLTYVEYIRRNAELDEAQAGIKIASRNINNLRYGDDTSLMAVSEEELKSLLMKVKDESENAGLKLSIQQMKIMALVPSLHGK